MIIRNQEENIFIRKELKKLIDFLNKLFSIQYYRNCNKTFYIYNV